MAGLLDPRQGDGSYVVNRPSKWQQTWDIFAPYITAPAYAVKGLMDADPYTLLTDTGPAADEAVANSFNAAGAVTAGGSVVPKPANALNMGIKAYHGSPHSFDKFSMDKIGTGEGAQAYGHGLYFAENEGVAKGYRDTLGANQKKWLVDGEVVGRYGENGTPVGSAAARVRQVLNGDGVVTPEAAEAAKARLAKTAASNKGMISAKDLQSQMDAIDGLVGRKVSEDAGGSMYEVNIDADPDAFLDWDRPLSEQPEAVRIALTKLNIDTGSMTAKDRVETINAALQGDPRLAHLLGRGGINITGDTLYKGLSDSLGAVDWPVTADAATRAQYRANASAKTADVLKEAGIPGIKYLDAGSRSAGDGTRNYVVFDDRLIEILRKYGLAGLLGGSAAMNAMQDEPQEQY